MGKAGTWSRAGHQGPPGAQEAVCRASRIKMPSWQAPWPPSLWTCCLKEEGLWGQSEVSGHPTPAREKAGGPLTSSFIRVSRSFLAAPRMASVFLLGMVSSESLSGKWKTAGGVSARTTLFLDLRRRQAA